MSRNKIFAGLVLSAILAAFAIEAIAQSISSPTRSPGVVGPKPLSSRFYALARFMPMTQASAYPSALLDNNISFYPFTVEYPLTVATLNVRTITGAGSSAIKMAVWVDSGNGRPSGTAVVGSNTGQATTGTPSTASITVSYTFQPNTVYWAGFAVTTAAPTFVAISGNNGTSMYLYSYVGKNALDSNNNNGLSATFTYSNDIMALDLTGASFNDVTANGIPVLIGGT